MRIYDEMVQYFCSPYRPHIYFIQHTFNIAIANMLMNQ